MNAVTGVVTATHEGQTYRLILGMGGLARLQQEYGVELAPLVAMEDEGRMPDFSVLLRVTQVALERFHPDADPYLADDLLTADVAVAVRILNAAFGAMKGSASVKAGGVPASVNTAARPAKPKAKSPKRR